MIALGLPENRIDPSKMTTVQAEKMVQAIKMNSNLRIFNSKIFVKAAMQSIRRGNMRSGD
jgi:hypothetical protein